MMRILLVNESETDRARIMDLLEKLECQVTAVASGRDALGSLDQNPVDLIISELFLPEMDGMQLLRRVKELKRVVPVIITTGQGSEETAIKCLARGAAGYLPESLIQRDLKALVTQVYERDQSDRRRAGVVRGSCEQTLRLTIGNRRSTIPSVVAYLQECIEDFGLFSATEMIRIGITLEECLLNSMIHGNLEVSSELRERDDDAYDRLVETRSGELPYRARRLYIEARIHQQGVEFHVRDEGPGFDKDSIPDPVNGDSRYRVSGRGISLMRSFMDGVEYNACGNAVTLIKHAPCEPAEDEPATD